MGGGLRHWKGRRRRLLSNRTTARRWGRSTRGSGETLPGKRSRLLCNRIELTPRPQRCRPPIAPRPRHAGGSVSCFRSLGLFRRRWAVSRRGRLLQLLLRRNVQTYVLLAQHGTLTTRRVWFGKRGNIRMWTSYRRRSPLRPPGRRVIRCCSLRARRRSWDGELGIPGVALAVLLLVYKLGV